MPLAGDLVLLANLIECRQRYLIPMLAGFVRGRGNQVVYSVGPQEDNAPALQFQPSRQKVVFAIVAQVGVDHCIDWPLLSHFRRVALHLEALSFFVSRHSLTTLVSYGCLILSAIAQRAKSGIIPELFFGLAKTSKHGNNGPKERAIQWPKHNETNAMP